MSVRISVLGGMLVVKYSVIKIVSVEAGKKDVWICIAVFVPVRVRVMNWVFVAVCGGNWLVSVRKKLSTSVWVIVEAGCKEVSNKVLIIMLVACGSVEIRVISARLVSVEGGRSEVSTKVLTMMLVACGRNEVRVISTRLVSVAAGCKEVSTRVLMMVLIA